MKKILITILLILTLSACEPEVVIDEVIPDTTPPIISLLGEEDIYLEIGDDYIEYGATAFDDVDGDTVVIISSNVDTDTVSHYVVEYNAKDTSNNESLTVIRNVYVTNKEPGIITSFSYSSYDLLGGMVQVFDTKNVATSLFIALYNGETLIEKIEIEGTRFPFEFNNIEMGVNYDLVVEGTYLLGPGMGEIEFQKDSIKAGTLRKLNNRIRDQIEDEEVADAIIHLVYLPYNRTEDVYLERISLELLKIDKELLLGLTKYTTDRVIFTPLTIPSVYEYFYLKGLEARGTGTTYDNTSGICCDPMVVKYNEGRVAEQVLLHEFGHSIDLILLNGISYSEEFLGIWEAEKHILFPENDYYLDYPEEYFAESFAYYYQGEFTRNELLEKAPLTFAIIDSLVERYKEEYNILD